MIKFKVGNWPGGRVAAWVGLLVACVLSLTGAAAPAPLADVAINREAGRGSDLFVMVRLPSGREVPFFVDTGYPGTVLDRSLESELGPYRGTTAVRFLVGGETRLRSYPAPKLSLGKVVLQTEATVFTHDLLQIYPGVPVAGILGMDILQHYCVQLDFTANRLRLLDPDQAADPAWGRAWPLTLHNDASGDNTYKWVSVRETLAGEPARELRILTCGYFDLAVQAKEFEAQRRAPAVAEIGPTWLCAASGRFGGEVYTNLVWWERTDRGHFGSPHIGLRFWSRHLVTMNFPKQMMYLRRTSAGPLPVVTLAQDYFSQSAKKFLTDLASDGALPGCRSTDTNRLHDLSQIQLEVDEMNPVPPEDRPYAPAVRTFSILNAEDGLLFLYTVVQAHVSTGWKLQRICVLNKQLRVIQDYRVP